MTSHANTHIADAKLQRRLRRLIDGRGLARVSADLSIARESLARYLADIHVQAGTFRLIESTLAALPASEPVARAPRRERRRVVPSTPSQGGGRGFR